MLSSSELLKFNIPVTGVYLSITSSYIPTNLSQTNHYASCVSSAALYRRQSKNMQILISRNFCAIEHMQTYPIAPSPKISKFGGRPQNFVLFPSNFRFFLSQKIVHSNIFEGLLENFSRSFILTINYNFSYLK